jgi:predicted acylesterase/phospholipase RssA
MNPYRIVVQGGKVTARIQFKGKEIPVTITAKTDALSTANQIVRRLVRDSVQGRLVKDLHVDDQSVKTMNITPDLPADSKYFSNGIVFLSLDAAQNIRGSKFALVLSGGTDRGLAHAGFLQMMDRINLRPDIVVGTSAGAIMGSIYALKGSGEAVKNDVYSIIQNYSWQDLLDIDFRGLSNISRLSGFMTGNNLISAIRKEGEIGESGFFDTKFDLYIYGVDLNSGQGLVFCDYRNVYDKLAEDPRSRIKSLDKKYSPKIFEGDVSIAEAMRASIGMPLIFKPHTLGYERLIFDFTDGGTRQNCAVTLAASLIDVGSILAINLGYAGQQDGRYSEKNAVENLLQNISIQLYNQLGFLNDPVLKGVSVRVINPGMFNIGTPQAFMQARNLVVSARRTFELVINQACPNGFRMDKFFSRWTKEQIKAITAGMEMERWGGSDSNVYSLVDREALTLHSPDDPIWKYYYEPGEDKITPKQPSKSTKDWILDQATEQLGWLKTRIAAANIGFLIWLLSEKKKRQTA